MNTNKAIKKLFSSYIEKTISKEDFNELKNWVNQSVENKNTFIEYLRVYKVNRNISFVESLDKDIAWNKIISRVNRPFLEGSKSQKSETKRFVLTTRFLKYAAVAVVFLSVGYFVFNNNFLKSDKDLIPENSIVLEMEDGSLKILNETSSNQLIDLNGKPIGKQQGTHLTYEKKGNNEKLVYNTLNIPYGKRFNITLSDGTKVFLNAGSSLKYPINFIDGKSREVFLSGEAHFDVIKDARNPFIVTSENFDVTVLGTVFNVSAYPEDIVSDVVLIEGSVSMQSTSSLKTNGQILKPGFKGSINKNNNQITSEKVNTGMYTSWVKGELFFRNMPFKNIVKKLERHYNREIIVLNENLDTEIFNASFKDEPIENVLSYFEDSFNIKHHIKNQIIYIN
ncbi:hypothetical protein PK35_00465 [Tamlana nanhaiensis]|uniref:Iron dicitrate transport regulator FecR n=1 Tax=Neotamlana nanhaiensis TaxID=1382798 RepID=A0A0D7W5E3_9FLAO|nr:FecR family protein [Tamlana nanhaiensis]KJD34330.1 hypothetical protein PK35_00465 [Tamlana nanhaiensis]